MIYNRLDGWAVRSGYGWEEVNRMGCSRNNLKAGRNVFDFLRYLMSHYFNIVFFAPNTGDKEEMQSIACDVRVLVRMCARKCSAARTAVDNGIESIGQWKSDRGAPFVGVNPNAHRPLQVANDCANDRSRRTRVPLPVRVDSAFAH